MSANTFAIWCNAQFPAAAMSLLSEGTQPHRLLLAGVRNELNLAAGAADPTLEQADIALGQPDPKQILSLSRLRWVHLTTAGYTRYDTAAVRQAFAARGAVMTNSSGVYDEPCAQHVLAMMLAVSRQLPQCWQEQATTHSWRAAEHRIRCHLLIGQTALILGMGAIARRLMELLAPMKMNLIGVRRQISGSEPIRTFPFSHLKQLLPQADHVVNLLPANDSTNRLIDAAMMAAMKPSAIFYNIGRGTTIDQDALVQALQSGQIAGAYLDVTDPEPLPVSHPLWKLPNCWITPHTAGGHADEFERLVRHFLNNLRRFERGDKLLDQII